MSNTKTMQDFALPLPITQTARQVAQKFAQQQPTRQKALQVYHNTLSVWVVNDYLQLMEIQTNLTAGDSWNPVLQLSVDTADLEIVGVGRIECRPVTEVQQTCLIPPEVTVDRVGYVVVQIDTSYQEAILLGFVPQVSEEELALNQLQSPERLLEHLHNLQPEQQLSATTTPAVAVNLAQWLQEVFDAGWDNVTTVLTSELITPRFSFRDMTQPLQPCAEGIVIERAKLIELGQQSVSYPVALIVGLKPETDTTTQIWVQVHPVHEQIYLPEHLQLVVLDETGAIFRQAQARTADNYIQMQFSGRSGERFSIKVVHDDLAIAEFFVI